MRMRRSGMTRLFSDAMKMTISANQVIALRLMKIATGAPGAKRESQLMVREKMHAAAEAGMEAAKSVATGKPHRAPARALAAYKKRVDRNLRRLSKG